MRTVSRSSWTKYIVRLRNLSDKAADDLIAYIKNGHDPYADPSKNSEVIRYAYALATKYGEGAASLAAEMYDALAELSGKIVPPAVPAKTATYGEVAKAVNGTQLQSSDPNVMAGAIGRTVKMAGVDTIQQNALRDGAEWAWIPVGDTCAFCLMLASNGWQKASKRAIKGGHAEHIHANCDCTYAIRFSPDVEVEGYDPDTYKKMYDEAEGRDSKDKINYMRRQFYAENKAVVGTADIAEEYIPNIFKLNKVSFSPADTIIEAEQFAKDNFIGGGLLNLTGNKVSYKGFELDIANKINKRLLELFNTFDIDKLGSLESYGKANKKIWGKNAEAPMFTTNLGNIGLNNTLIKSQKFIDKYNKQGNEAFQFVMDNIDLLKGESKLMAERYKLAGRELVGDTIEDFITHEIGHHISYMPQINKKLTPLYKSDNWKEYAAKLSGYASKSFGEYFAESFTAFCNGEQDKLQPELIDIFNSLRKRNGN